MATCAHCKRSFVFTQSAIEPDAGDWIIRCPYCGAKNIVAPPFINQTPPITFAGYRD